MGVRKQTLELVQALWRVPVCVCAEESNAFFEQEMYPLSLKTFLFTFMVGCQR